MKMNGEYRQLCEKADWLISKLKAEFVDELSTQPYRFGSTEMGTALEENAVIDICLPLRAKFFSSTEDMFFIVQEYLESLVGVDSIIKVRSQKKSIACFLKSAVRALQKGIRIEYVSRLMGHASVKNTEIYAKILDSELDKAIEIFN